MQYRKFGRYDFEVSALGFGTMRLPTEGDIDHGNRLSGKIVEDEAIRMLRHAIDHGVNYIDTAYGYHEKRSETLTGKALKDGYRDKVMLATKSPVWLVEKPEDFDRILDEQLKKLQTEYLDFYLLHSLNLDLWENKVLKFDLIQRAEAAQKAGKFKYLGFSFHDEYDVFVKIVDSYDKWDFCQIQYNYMDIDYQAGTKGLKYAASKGLAVVVMEPLLGGRLANPPKYIEAMLEENGVDRSPVDLALQWLWSQPEVTVVLSGMSTMQQVEENLESAKNSKVGLLSPEVMEIIDRVRNKYRERAVIPCTGCSYCMPCPNDVDIPKNFDIYNNGIIHEDIKGAKVIYNGIFSESKRASECVGCKVCEDKCPQGIEISTWMEKVDKALKGLPEMS
ncbi:MAG: aldo/keto reductase [Acetivibrionales bacterium]|jgi:predicted aldo/keto reductase-like oxidoreductase